MSSLITVTKRGGGTYCLACSRDAYVTLTTAVSLSVFTEYNKTHIHLYTIHTFIYNKTHIQSYDVNKEPIQMKTDLVLPGDQGI